MHSFPRFTPFGLPRAEGRCAELAMQDVPTTFTKVQRARSKRGKSKRSFHGRTRAASSQLPHAAGDDGHMLPLPRPEPGSVCPHCGRAGPGRLLACRTPPSIIIPPHRLSQAAGRGERYCCYRGCIPSPRLPCFSASICRGA